MSSPSSQGSEDSTSDSNEPECESSGNANTTRLPDESLPDIGPECPATQMSPGSPQSSSLVMAFNWQTGTDQVQASTEVSPSLHKGQTPAVLTSYAEGSPAKTSPSQESEPALPGKDQDSSMTQHESQTLFSDQEDGSLLRTYPDYFPATKDATSPSYSRRWPTSGFTTSPTECWTADTSECPSGGGEYSSLPDVLEATVPERFYLSPKAAAGILRRAEKRGKALPPALDKALRALGRATRSHGPNLERGATGAYIAGDSVTAKCLTTSQERQDYDTQDFVVKAFAQNTRDEVRYLGPNGEGDHTGALASQPGMKQTTYMHEQSGVRRLTPVECERLQGFPDGFTIPDDTPWQEHPRPDGPRYAQMGNAVTVPVAEWIGRRIVDHQIPAATAAPKKGSNE
jgi:hypothetical protein